MRSPAFALDRSGRRISADGHLHVERSIITAAEVNPYYGYEIPNARELGLDPDRVYPLFRDPSELRKAVPTLDGKPLTFNHRPLTADDHAHDVVVGSVYSPRWEDPATVTAELVVWDGAAITGINNGSQRALSAGYRYTLQPRAGTYRGIPYFGTMTDISFNHVALVTQPRVEIAMVGDAKPKPKRRFLIMDVSTSDDAEKKQQIIEFLADKLENPDMLRFKSMLDDLCVDPAGPAEGVAMDRQRFNRATADAANKSYLSRFPHANRLAR